MVDPTQRDCRMHTHFPLFAKRGQAPNLFFFDGRQECMDTQAAFEFFRADRGGKKHGCWPGWPRFSSKTLGNPPPSDASKGTGTREAEVGDEMV